MAFFNNCLLFAHGDCGLTIADTIDPSQMRLRKVIKNGDYVMDVFACDGCAFITKIGRGLEILDIRDMEQIKQSEAIRHQDVRQASASMVIIFNIADTCSLTVLKRR